MGYLLRLKKMLFLVASDFRLHLRTRLSFRMSKRKF